MGQQQLLLIVLGVIIVGIAVVVGINMFSASSVNANREAVVSDLTNLAAMAQQHFRKPVELGGGGNSYVGFVIPAGLLANANGDYTIEGTPSATGIVFKGVGKEKVDGTNNVEMTITVSSTSANAVALVH